MCGAYLTRFQRNLLAGRASITRILQPTSASYVGSGSDPVIPAMFAA
jgi:hypothetical protein